MYGPIRSQLVIDAGAQSANRQRTVPASEPVAAADTVQPLDQSSRRSVARMGGTCRQIERDIQLKTALERYFA